jgi:hypothetical protein
VFAVANILLQRGALHFLKLLVPDAAAQHARDVGYPQTLP